MQDFVDQANKNGVPLLNKGKCQFCGADYQNGIFECMDNYNNGLEMIAFSKLENHIHRFLSVDAHALQHPEIHGRWSNHFHLTRLNLIFEKEVIWDYKKSPQLSNYLNNYKLNRPNELLNIPKPLERGSITAKDLKEAKTANECEALIRKWAEEVYNAWSVNHTLVSEIAINFLNINKSSETYTRKATNR